MNNRHDKQHFQLKSSIEKLEQTIVVYIKKKVKAIKKDPKCRGCDKDTLIIILVIIGFFGGLGYLIAHNWKNITGMIQPFFEWF